MVDATGRVARLEIVTDSDDAGTPSAAQPEFYAMTCGSERWYLIRLQRPVVEQPVARSRELPLPQIASSELVASDGSGRPFSNRKFDFTRYATPDRAEESLVEEIARPEPPDLPVSR